MDEKLKNVVQDSDVESIYDFFTTTMESKSFPRKVTIKFTTENKKIFTQSYPENYTIGEIKNQLMNVFAVPATFMDIIYNKQSQDNEKKLTEFELKHYAILEMKVKSLHENYEILAENAYKDLIIPDVITVRIDDGENGFREVCIEIENRSIVKPFIGGFTNKENGLEYHHGYTQTGPFPPKLHPMFKNHRDTQTYFFRNRKIDTEYSRGTQMSNEQVWIPNVNDKILLAGKYETADERGKRIDKEGKVRIIQRYFRAWKIRKALKILSQEYHKRLQMQKQEEDYLKRENIIRKKREIIAKIFPRSRKDFGMLYNMIENWKKGEVARINAHMCGPAKIAELYCLLEKEIELLRDLDAQLSIVRDDMKIQKVIDFFKKISTPIKWNSKYKNLPIEMDTLETQKGREYKELYLSIADRSIPKDKYMSNLLDVKLLIKNDNCHISLELCELIDRACELITRGLSDEHLEVLKKRIQALLLHHFKQAQCSFGVANRIKRVKEKKMENDLFYCIRCKALKCHHKFLLDSRTKSLNVCKSCSWDDRILEPWVDLAPYRFILRCIRREERRKCSPSSIAFILQDRDIHLLITKVWHSHSAINECNDIYKLRLCRWFKDEDWAPWNSILLTNKEAKAHLEIRKLEEVYDKEFLHHIYNKHSLARSYYANANGINAKYQEKGRIDTKWNEIIEINEFIAVNSKTKIFLSCH